MFLLHMFAENIVSFEFFVTDPTEIWAFIGVTEINVLVEFTLKIKCFRTKDATEVFPVAVSHLMILQTGRGPESVATYSTDEWTLAGMIANMAFKGRFMVERFFTNLTFEISPVAMNLFVLFQTA